MKLISFIATITAMLFNISWLWAIVALNRTLSSDMKIQLLFIFVNIIPLTITLINNNLFED